MGLLKKGLAATFSASLTAANVAASKVASFSLPVVGEAAVPAGFVGIAAAFLCSDLLGELYGKDEARDVVNGTIAALAVAYGILFSAILMPSAPFYEHADAFATVIGQGGYVVLASIATLLVSQNVDVSVFHKLKERSDVRAVRNLGSTAISQIVDTAMFIGLAFVGLPTLLGGDAVPLAAALSMVGTQYAVKLGVAALDTPLFYAVTSLTDG